MKTRNLYYTILLLFFLSNYKLGSAQINTSPIEYEILLSGNFGELRSSGFHTGIDIKTKGREGEIIKAIDDGYISRMQVSTTGYGKVIYITHNNGLKSVYGHLRDFEKKLDSSAKKIQYSRKSYTFNKYFKKDEIIVKKGQIIGYSGNTGTSFGPHLHFEIRTEKDIPINPLKFKYEIPDTISPVIRSLYVYNTKNNIRSKKKLALSKVNDSLYYVNLKTNDSIFFGIETFDRQNFSYNRNGTYDIKLIENNSNLFHYKFDSLNFNQKRLPIKFYDHKEFLEKNSKIIILRDEKTSDFDFYRNSSRGIFKVNENDIIILNIVLSDYNNNKTHIQIEIEPSDKDFIYDYTEDHFDKKIDKSLNYNITLNDLKLNFNKNTFYHDTSIDLNFEKDTLTVYNPNIILKNPYKVKFPENDKGNFIGSLDKNNNVIYVSSNRKEGYFEYKTKTLGKFFISTDTIGPIIKKINKKDRTNNKKIRLLIRDEGTGIKKYTARINNEWALFEYEPKKNLIQFKPDDFIELKEENELFIVVEDLLGNKTFYNETIYYKPWFSITKLSKNSIA